MIHFINPYTPTKQLADNYNYYASVFKDNDWLCFIDADAMFLNPYFGQQLQDIIIKHGKDYLAFTCKTNRVGNLTQCHNGRISNDFSLETHLKIERILRAKHYDEVQEMNPNYPLSGVLILAKVSTIKETPFRGGGMLGVDNNFHVDIAKKSKLGLMNGVYVFHKYRPDGVNNKEHLK